MACDSRESSKSICKEIALQRPKTGKFDYLGRPNYPAHSIAFKFFTNDALARGQSRGAHAMTQAAPYPRRSSGSARISAHNTLYLDFGAEAAAMPMRVAPLSSLLARCGGESRQPEKACARVW